MPRLSFFAVVAIALAALAYGLQASPLSGTLLAVSVYKIHLMSLGGFGGYWLDRHLFPYSRPHESLNQAQAAIAEAKALPNGEIGKADVLVFWQTRVRELVLISALAMIRRAFVVSACLICVGLGA
jgi:hypothetical protein